MTNERGRGALCWALMGMVVLTAVAGGGGVAPAQEGSDAAAGADGALGPVTPPLVIGGGVPFGLYFPLAGALCRLVETADGDARPCSVAPIPDSAQAIGKLRRARVDLALVQSDWLAHAVAGTSRFQEAGPADGLRAVAALHGEGLAVLVRAEDGPRRPADLAGMRVSRGPERSYRALLTARLLAAVDLSQDDLAMMTEEAVGPAIGMLCRGETDVVAAVTATPASLETLAPAGCAVRFLAIDAETAVDASDSMPGVRPLTLPLAPGGDGDGARGLGSFGLTAVLTASVDSDPEAVAAATRALIAGARDLATMHPALSGLSAEALPSASAFAPLHPAAEALYTGNGD